MDLPSTKALSKQMKLPVHNGFSRAHREYSSGMRSILDGLYNVAKADNWTPAQAKRELFIAVREARWDIYNGNRFR